MLDARRPGPGARGQVRCLAIAAAVLATVAPFGSGSGALASTRVQERTGAGVVPSVSFVVTLGTDARPACLESWARSEGINTLWGVGDSFAILRGPPPEVGRAFGVSIHHHRTASGRFVYATNHAAIVPDEVCSEVTGVGVIHSFVRPKLFDVPAGGLTPLELITAYDAAPLRTEGLSGQKQTVVLFETDGYHARDVESFAKHVGAPLDLQRYGGMASPDEGESTLDIETVDEIAPRAKIVYFNLNANAFNNAPTEAAAFIEAFDTAKRLWPGAVWSLSLGLCESDTSVWNAADLKAMNAAAASAEAGGTTVFAASGDSGGLDCTPSNDAGTPPRSSWKGVSAPASLPAVTGVGGTSLSTTADGTYVGETTWSEPLLSQGSGGGVSAVFPRPPWQTGLGTGGPDDVRNARQVPDVSADADPDTGTSIIDDGRSPQAGGTSLAAPMWAAFTVLIDQYLELRGQGAVGFFSPTLYSLAQRSPTYPPFHDVTVGGNDFYLATPGYDMVTGLGSPDVWNIARDLDGAG